jgi:hypothetical protein
MALPFLVAPPHLSEALRRVTLVLVIMSVKGLAKAFPCASLR